MRKSVYSLTLANEVVDRIDRMAYMSNKTRSGLINDILAEYVSLVTPEMRMRSIIGKIEAMLSGAGELRPAESRSDTMLTLCSALSYKYNPTVRYSVVLYRDSSPTIGELRVGFRTQNRELLTCMELFYQAWIQIEEAHIGEGEYRIDNGKLTRRLILRKNPNATAKDAETLGELIGEYIRTLDAAMKTFFQAPNSPEAIEEMQRLYRTHLSGKSDIV